MSYFASSDDLPEWARHLPRAWEKDWLKWSVALSTGWSDEDERATLPYLSNEDIASWTGKLLRDELEPHDADSRLFRPGDVLFNKLRPYLAKVFHADFAGTSSGELLCLRPSERVDARYLFYVLTSFGFIDSVDSHTFGSKMPRADWEVVGHQPLPLPSIEVQQRIARFLDEKTARIDALIEKKQALLERLAEKRKALITCAITGALSSEGQRQDRRDTWNGCAPLSWDVKRLRFVFQSCKNGVWGSEPEDENAVVCIRAADFDGQSGALNRGERTLRAVDETAFDKVRLRSGDLILEKSGGGEKQLVGRAVLFDDSSPSVCSNFLARCRPTEETDPRFLNFLMLAIYLGRGTFPHIKQSTGIQNLDTGSYFDTRVAIPALQVQTEIASFLDKATFEIDSVVSRVLRSVEHLSEWRNALLTAAVTGQLPELNG